MNDLVVTGGKLAIICIVAALALGIVNAITAPEIVRVKERQLKAALDQVSLGGSLGAPTEVGSDGVDTYYPLNVLGIRGYVLKLIGIGYGGEMEILGSFTEDGEILAITLMDNAETPGLGKEAERPEYMEMFVAHGGENDIPTSKRQLETGEADAISGATITFLGIAEALSAGERFVISIGDGR